MISSIVNMTKARGIGFQNDMIYPISEDLKRFRALTMHKTIIMGRKTYLSLKKPLPNRKHIVVSKDPTFMVSHELVTVVPDLFPILEQYQFVEEEVFVIGGGSVYAQALPYCTKLYLTINDGIQPADVFFPQIDARQWHSIERTTPTWDVQNQVYYWYETLVRKESFHEN